MEGVKACIAPPISWQRMLVVMSTGLGKTVTGLMIALLYRRVLWLAHREELIQQPAKTLAQIDPSKAYGVVKADRNEYMRPVVFASIQSACQPRRLAQLVAERFDIVVIDEAHHALSDSYKLVANELGCFTPGGPILIGLTATPERTDGAGLDEMFQGVAFQMGIRTAIDGGYLVEPSFFERPIRVDLDAITKSRGDFSVKELDLALMRAGIVDEIVATFEEHAANRKSIIFTVSVAQAEEVASALRQRGHAIAALSGETPPEQRRAMLRKLHTGELRSIVNCMVLTEGFDEPSIDCVILARPTQSKSLMIQMVGRGLRLFPGKSTCIVVDLVGVSKRNTLVQAAVIFGKRDEEDERKRSTSTEPDPFADPEEYWRKRLLSQIKGTRGAPRSSLNWLPDGEGGWLLDAGVFGTVRMIPAERSDDEVLTWRVDAVGVRAPGSPSRMMLNADAVNQETAQMIAEDYVRRVNAMNLAKKQTEMPWRNDPATAQQVRALKRAGVKGAEGLTRGTASDLLTQIKSKQAATPATPKQIAALRARGLKVSESISRQEAARMFARTGSR